MTDAELFSMVLITIVGVLGVVLPILPGGLLIVAGGALWAYFDGSTWLHWVVVGIMAVVTIAATVMGTVIPLRTSTRAGAGNRTLLFGAALGLAGFFFVPVVGLPLGYVLGIYLAERYRSDGHAAAWTATKGALKGVGLSVLIDLGAAAVMLTLLITAEATIL